jgi:hypothetical protein
MAGDLSTVELIGQLWPLVLAFISLVIILAKMDVRLGVTEEKIKTLFELWNKGRDK